jgi:hydrogenase 3 maturation protease
VTARGAVPALSQDGSLAESLLPRLRGRVVVLGIGNPLRGDDGAGSLVADHLLDLVAGGAKAGEGFLTVISVGEVPESFLGPVVAARPDTVLLVDAAEMGAPPGSVALLEVEDLPEGPLFTHRTPLRLLADVLRRETGADVFLLAIQPRHLEWGEAMSSEVEEAARMVSLILRSARAGEAPPC